MQRTSFLVIVVCGLVLASSDATTPCYAKSLFTSDFGGSLQAAVNAASDDDTIVVDVPSSGALISKRLHIRGTDTASAGALRLRPGASGTTIRHLHIEAGTAINGPNVDNITIEHCTIIGRYIGIRGRFSDGWHIHHNDISVSEGGGLMSNNGGIVLNAGCDDWDIHHNNITAQNKCIMLYNSAPDPTAVANVVIMHNICQSSNVGVMLRSWGEGGVQRSIDIKDNDFTLTDTPVLILADEVVEDSRCEPDSYVLDRSLGDLGVIDELAVRKNTYAD